MGRIFSVSRFATDDGDGIRTCVFFKGCPLSCAWCHNAESIAPEREISYIGKNCILCGACAAVCPRGLHSVRNGAHTFSRVGCDACGVCADACPSLALTAVGEDLGVEELAARVLRDRDFYGERGGVTLTGGEPTFQPRFAVAFAKTMHEAGVNVAVETCGFCSRETLLALAAYTDTFLFDCKASKEDHKRLTGVPDDAIVSNLAALSSAGKQIILRCPIVAGGNLTEAFIQKIGALSEYVDRVQLMPYHRTGVGKSALLGKPAQKQFDTPDAATLERIAQKVTACFGKKTTY